MSAFLCSDTHFQALADTLAEAASNNSHVFNHAASYFLDQCGYDNIYRASRGEVEQAAVEVTNQLHELNNLALYGRYGRKSSDMMSEEPPVKAIRYSMVHARPEAQYKAFQCLRYQCSEDRSDGQSYFITSIRL